MYVLALGSWATMRNTGGALRSADEGPLEVLRARSLIEGAIAEEVARGVEDQDIAELEQILFRMEGGTMTPRVAADREFHLYIAAKLQNKALSQLITELLDQGERPWARQFAIHFDNPETWTKVAGEHRKILGALAARRDPEQARKAMRNHLKKAHDRWASGFDGGEKTGF